MPVYQRPLIRDIVSDITLFPGNSKSRVVFIFSRKGNASRLIPCCSKSRVIAHRPLPAQPATTSPCSAQRFPPNPTVRSRQSRQRTPQAIRIPPFGRIINSTELDKKRAKVYTKFNRSFPPKPATNSPKSPHPSMGYSSLPSALSGGGGGSMPPPPEPPQPPFCSLLMLVGPTPKQLLRTAAKTKNKKNKKTTLAVPGQSAA